MSTGTPAAADPIAIPRLAAVRRIARVPAREAPSKARATIAERTALEARLAPMVREATAATTATAGDHVNAMRAHPSTATSATSSRRAETRSARWPATTDVSTPTPLAMVRTTATTVVDSPADRVR